MHQPRPQAITHNPASHAISQEVEQYITELVKFRYSQKCRDEGEPEPIDMIPLLAKRTSDGKIFMAFENIHGSAPDNYWTNWVEVTISSASNFDMATKWG